ncbi:MAG: hypothetical protein IPJ88_06295 [Myxococcales bacterium]|nr:MAG: hypothetical protein IPJ88_06295 [Myxococcales bacterium]
MDVFTEEDLAVVLPELQGAARHNKLSRELRKGNLIRLRRGVYALGDSWQEKGLHPFAVANRLYMPSYVSLESALKHYDLIPERVAETSSVSRRASYTCSNVLGAFSYHWLPERLFRAGFVREVTQGHAYLIASPLKAFLDLCHLRDKGFVSLDEMVDDLRLDTGRFRELLREQSNQSILDLAEVYRSERLRKVIDVLLWELR